MFVIKRPSISIKKLFEMLNSADASNSRIVTNICI